MNAVLALQALEETVRQRLDETPGYTGVGSMISVFSSCSSIVCAAQ
ncbi:hypothetical protein [Streptomyces tritici]